MNLSSTRTWTKHVNVKWLGQKKTSANMPLIPVFKSLCNFSSYTEMLHKLLNVSAFHLWALMRHHLSCPQELHNRMKPKSDCTNRVAYLIWKPLVWIPLKKTGSRICVLHGIPSHGVQKCECILLSSKVKMQTARGHFTQKAQTLYNQNSSRQLLTFLHG